MSNLASVLTKQSKLDEAEEAARAVVDGCRLVHGEGHAETERAQGLLDRLLRGAK